MKREGILLIALFVAGLGALWYMAGYLDARRALKTTCELIAEEYVGADESRRPAWLEDAWDTCGEADALP